MKAFIRKKPNIDKLAKPFHFFDDRDVVTVASDQHSNLIIITKCMTKHVFRERNIDPFGFFFTSVFLEDLWAEIHVTEVIPNCGQSRVVTHEAGVIIGSQSMFVAPDWLATEKTL